MYYLSELESKAHTASVTPLTSLSSTGYVYESCNLLAVGTDNNARTGQKICCTSITIHALYSILPSDQDELADSESCDFLRFDLCLDNSCNGTAPTIGGTNGIFNGSDPLEFNNLRTVNRYKILYTEKITFNSPSMPFPVVNASLADGTGDITTDPYWTTSKQFQYFEKTINLNNLEIIYSGNSATLANIKSNNLFFAWRSINGRCIIERFRYRLRYHDY